MLRTSFSSQRHRRCSSFRSTRVIPQGYGRGETHFKIQLPVPINSKIYSLFPQRWHQEGGKGSRADGETMSGRQSPHSPWSRGRSSTLPPQYNDEGMETRKQQEWVLSHFSGGNLKSFISTYLWIDLTALTFWRKLKGTLLLCVSSEPGASGVGTG